MSATRAELRNAKKRLRRASAFLGDYLVRVVRLWDNYGNQSCQTLESRFVVLYAHRIAKANADVERLSDALELQQKRERQQ